MNEILEKFSDQLDLSKFCNYDLTNGVFIKKKERNKQGYAKNFGIQWNTFRKTQFDSSSKTKLTEERLFGCSGWSPNQLQNQYVLEIGSGAGRFTEVLLLYGAKVISIDMSDAVFSNAKSNKNSNLLLIKESLYNLPLNDLSFDFVLCYGVVQHTPEPEMTYRKCVSFVKENGNCSFDHYKSKVLPSPLYHPKYFWRPITTKIQPQLLLQIIQFYIPFYFNIDTYIKKLPLFGNLIAGLIPIPCWNYTGVSSIVQSKQNLIEWAVMDTFDALGAKYDKPWSLRRLNNFASKLKVKSFHAGIGGNGLILNTFGNTKKIS